MTNAVSAFACAAASEALLVAVAVPVRDRRGRVVAAIAVHAPAARMSLDAALGHVGEMREAASRIASTLK